MTEKIIELENLSKTYGKNTVLKNISLTVEKGEILAVIGPSGSGKSTLLRLLDGLEETSSGKISLFGEELTKKSRHRLRDKTGMLFQKTVLFDRSVEENIALGLSYRHIPREERKKRVADALEKMGMSEYAKRSGRKLSGGEGQRVAFARVLVTRPELVFLDEPTANLDPLATAGLEDMILRENHENGTTIIINTHDQTQAQRLGHCVAVLINGEIRQIGKPDDIWDNPADTETARFVGFQNIIPASEFPGESGDGFVLLRAEDILISTEPTDIAGVITSLTRRGAFLEIRVDIGTELLITLPWKEYENQFTIGDKVYLTWGSDAAVRVKR